MRYIPDCYALFKKHKEFFDQAKTFTEFIQLTGLTYLQSYVGGWVESAFDTFKAGKETIRPLINPTASKFSDIFKSVVFIPTDDRKQRPEGATYVGGSAGLAKHMGGRRGWSERTPDTRCHYGAKFYGCFAIPIEPIKVHGNDSINYSFEAIQRTDGILITRKMHDYCGEDWYALLDVNEKIEDMFDDETKAFLAAERQAEVDAWGTKNKELEK